VVRGASGVRGPRSSVKDPAPQVFQALRIAVNSELEHLQAFLDDVLPRSLVPGGRVAIISFHSVEDRLVKQALRPECGWTPIPQRPISPTPAEVRVNPRSRSARLRVALRTTAAADRS
jgi:16S rRNA (cytosine1402-N4)-methyltransferase